MLIIMLGWTHTESLHPMKLYDRISSHWRKSSLTFTVLSPTSIANYANTRTHPQPHTRTRARSHTHTEQHAHCTHTSAQHSSMTLLVLWPAFRYSWTDTSLTVQIWMESIWSFDCHVQCANVSWRAIWGKLKYRVWCIFINIRPCSPQSFMLYLSHQTSHVQAHLMLQVPYETLCYVVGAVNYGGRVTDYMDQVHCVCSFGKQMNSHHLRNFW